MAKGSASRAADLGSNPSFHSRLFPGGVIPETTKAGTPVATLPNVWRYRVSDGAGWLSVSIL